MEDIFDGFEAVTDQEWREKIEKDIKGNFQDILWQDENKLVFQPFYRKSELAEIPYLKEVQAANQSAPDWKITQLLEYCADNGKSSLHSIKKALESGADSILIKSSSDAGKLARILKDNSLDLSNILIEQSTDQLEDFSQQVENALLLLDPIGECMRNGNPIALAGSLIGKNPQSFFQKGNYKILIDGSLYKNAGANHIQELALMLQQAVEYLDFFTEQGIDAQSIVDKMILKVGVGTSYFAEISKVRALRFLWAKMLSSYGIQAKTIILAETCNYYLSVIEAHNNLLRQTTQVMSAAFVNCNFITSPSFDLSDGAKKDFSDRMARNIQIILKEESYANKVSDPAAGSYYIEETTYKFTEAAWERFLTMEKSGGLNAGYESGEIQMGIKAVHEKRLEAMKNIDSPTVNIRREMLGVNLHRSENIEKIELKSKNEKGSSFVRLKARNLSESYLRKEERK